MSERKDIEERLADVHDPDTARNIASGMLDGQGSLDPGHAAAATMDERSEGLKVYGEGYDEQTLFGEEAAPPAHTMRTLGNTALLQHAQPKS